MISPTLAERFDALRAQIWDEEQTERVIQCDPETLRRLRAERPREFSDFSVGGENQVLAGGTRVELVGEPGLRILLMCGQVRTLKG